MCGYYYGAKSTTYEVVADHSLCKLRSNLISRMFRLRIGHRINSRIVGGYDDLLDTPPKPVMKTVPAHNFLAGLFPLAGYQKTPGLCRRESPDKREF